MKSARFSTVLKICRIAVSAGLLLWLISTVDYNEVLVSIRKIHLWFLALAFLSHFLGYYLSALRWRSLMNAHGMQPTLGYLFQSYVISSFFNNLLPSTVGGDVSRTYDCWRLSQSKSNAIVIVVVDRLLGLLALLLIAAVASFYYPNVTNLGYVNSIVLGGSVTLGLALSALFSPLPVIGSIERRILSTLSSRASLITEPFLSAFKIFNNRGSLAGYCLVVSLLLQINVIVHYYFVGRSLGLSIPLHAYFVIIPLAIATMMIPLSINGIGIRENIFVLLLGGLGVTKEEALVFAWLAYLTVLLQGVIGGITYISRK